MVLSCGKDNMVKITDCRTFQVERQLRAPGFSVAGVWCKAAWGADERYVTAGSSDGTVIIWAVGSPSHALLLQLNA
jgi:autophagy-related protein 16